MDLDRVRQFIDLLFDHIETVSANEFYQHIDQADSAIGEIDPDDVLYVACALSCEAAIWSDDSDFNEQDLVSVFTTGEVIGSFDTV